MTPSHLATRSAAGRVLGLMLSLALSGSAAHACWQPPQPETVEELAHVVENQQRRQVARARAQASSTTLALSDGRMRTAYGAGLLVGWGETGRRPDFALVTGVGLSALIAPFAFVGSGEDARIADIFVCDPASLREMAETATSALDVALLERIAHKHNAGGRLLVALPGSAARRESVWDIGAMAASRHPKTQLQIRHILLAALDLTTHPDPAVVPAIFGTTVDRNPTFRLVGAGQPFLIGSLPRRASATYLIHSGVLFPDEGEAYMAARARSDTTPAARAVVPSLVPAHDVFRDAQAAGADAYIASPRPYLLIQPTKDFDAPYMRALFLDAYRQARMGKEWRRTFPDRDGTRRY